MVGMVMAAHCPRTTITSCCALPSIDVQCGQADEASTPPGGGELMPRGDLRASHEDRGRVVEVLTGAAGDGRLTREELEERVAAALRPAPTANRRR
jgi:uncharacterized protein DUF1707